MTKLRVLVRAIAATLVWASISPLPNAVAGTVAKVTVTPSSVHAKDHYAQVTHKLIGTGAVVTVKVGPNSVLKPYWPVEVMECDAHPSSEDDCDLLTTLAHDQLTKLQVEANGNGSVTIRFLLWAPLPQLWDPASVLKVGPGHPVALWVGDDPSNWASTGVVSAPVRIMAANGKPATHSSVKGAIAPVTAHRAVTSHGTSAGEIIALGAIIFVVLAGTAVTVQRRRRRAVTRNRRAITI
jgi:hypothetical protein